MQYKNIVSSIPELSISLGPQDFQNLWIALFGEVSYKYSGKEWIWVANYAYNYFTSVTESYWMYSVKLIQSFTNTFTKWLAILIFSFQLISKQNRPPSTFLRVTRYHHDIIEEEGFTFHIPSSSLMTGQPC